MLSTSLISLALILVSFGQAFPNVHPRADAGGVLIVPPPNLSPQTGLKQIPDADHPFRAPGPGDQRGPCPGLNTLANHGYLPRNGIASFSQIIEAAREGFNMDYNISAAVGALAMVGRGNIYLDLLSIGGPSPLVPPLPGNIDGPITRGLAAHGRFEGDVSLTRQDAAIGDNKNFQVDLYDQLLITLGQYGDDSPITGNRSVFNVRTMAEFKYRRFVEDQKANKKLEFHVGRYSLSFGETTFPVLFFPNGTTGIANVEIVGSFFRNQTFPQNWHRSPKSITPGAVSKVASTILAYHPDVLPGANDAQGNYVHDNITDPACAEYNDIIGNLPGVLLNTTGILRKNVDTLFGILHDLLGAGCPVAVPHGPAGV